MTYEDEGRQLIDREHDAKQLTIKHDHEYRMARVRSREWDTVDVIILVVITNIVSIIMAATLARWIP